MGNSWKYVLVSIAIGLGAMITGCGGGGGGGSSGASVQTKTLRWEPPSAYTDGSPLQAATDLDSFEIYVNQDGIFSENDQPAAAVAVINPGTGQVTTSFDLAQLAPFLTKGVEYQISVRAVAITGLKSDFSPSARFLN